MSKLCRPQCLFIFILANQPLPYLLSLTPMILGISTFPLIFSVKLWSPVPCSVVLLHLNTKLIIHPCIYTSCIGSYTVHVVPYSWEYCYPTLSSSHLVCLYFLPSRLCKCRSGQLSWQQLVLRTTRQRNAFFIIMYHWLKYGPKIWPEQPW